VGLRTAADLEAHGVGGWQRREAKLNAFSFQVCTGRKQVSVEAADKKQIILFCAQSIPTAEQGPPRNKVLALILWS
jgi:hypothetical protein